MIMQSFTPEKAGRDYCDAHQHSHRSNHSETASPS